MGRENFHHITREILRPCAQTSWRPRAICCRCKSRGCQVAPIFLRFLQYPTSPRSDGNRYAILLFLHAMNDEVDLAIRSQSFQPSRTCVRTVGSIASTISHFPQGDTTIVIEVWYSDQITLRYLLSSMAFSECHSLRRVYEESAKSKRSLFEVASVAVSRPFDLQHTPLICRKATEPLG